jgi:pilus assembly protein CpaE
MRTLVLCCDVFDSVSDRLREVLPAKLNCQSPVVAPHEDAEKQLTQVQPEMAVVVLSPDPDLGLLTLRKARSLMDGYILAVGQASEPRLILRALHEGADHYLDEAELETGLEAIRARLRGRTEVAAPAGRLIAVLGASGGSGASTLAVNIATVLAGEHKKCALIDLKPGRGDLAALLDLKPDFHLADLCLNIARLDQAMFEKLLVAHPSGVHLLAAPQVFDEMRLVTTQGTAQALALARRYFAHVVVDLEDCFHEEQLLALRQAGVILVVSRLDFTSLRNVRRILNHLEQHNVGRDTVRLVVNRHGQANELPQADAEEALGGKLDYFIPDDPKTINGANNTGIPAVLKSPSARVCQGIVQLTRGILERRRADRAEPSALARLFAR